MEYCGCGDLAQKVERYKRRRQYIDEDVMVYNFEVDVVHSYLSSNILSHNKQTGTSGGTINTDLDNDRDTDVGTVGSSARTVRTVTTTTTIGGTTPSGGSYD